MKVYILGILTVLFNLNSSANLIVADSLYDAGDYYSAINEYKSSNLGDGCNSYNSIGVSYYMVNDFVNASIYFFKALECGEAKGDKDIMDKSFNNIGLIHYEQGDYNSAIKYYNKSLEIAESINDNSSVSYTLNNIGLANLNLSKYELAIFYFEKSIEINKYLNDMEFVSENYVNLGKTFSLMGDKYKAIEYYEMSIEINKEFDNKYTLSTNLSNLASIYNELGEYELAISNAIKSNEIVDELGNIGVKKRNLETLSDVYEKIGELDKSLMYHKEYVTYKDSIYNENKTNTIYNLQVKYETTQKDNEIELLNKNKIINEKEIENKNNIIYFTLICIFLFVVLSIIIFRGYIKSKKMNSIITESKKEIENKNKDITDSMNYAKRIQKAMLSKYNAIKSSINESFILFKPKDIVSGDFYWIEEYENKTLFSIADCTGHGVPGAFMSFIGHNGLNKIVNEYNVTEPAEILNNLNTIVADNFSYSEEEVKDGMDMTVCSFDNKSKVLQFAGANNPMYIIRESSKGILDGQTVSMTINGIDLYKIRGDKNYVGGATKKFTNKEFQLEEGDTVYLFTDGYADQFGGVKGKKFMYKRLQKLLINNFNDTLDNQKAKLYEALADWIEGYEQVDDISIMGFKA